MVTGGAATPHGDAAPLYPDDFPDGLSRASSAWDLAALLPTPLRRWSCPFCSSPLAMKDWKLHAREGIGSENPWRCDVRMKCMTCGFVPMFGVLMEQAAYERAVELFGRDRWIHWRIVRDEEVRNADRSHQ